VDPQRVFRGLRGYGMVADYQVADIGVLLRWAEVGVRVGIVGVVVVGLVTGGTWLQLVCCALV
jgi:hypothetical protein